MCLDKDQDRDRNRLGQIENKYKENWRKQIFRDFIGTIPVFELASIECLAVCSDPMTSVLYLIE